MLRKTPIVWGEEWGGGLDGGKAVNPFLHHLRDGLAVSSLKLSVLLWYTRFRQDRDTVEIRCFHKKRLLRPFVYTDNSHWASLEFIGS